MRAGGRGGRQGPRGDPVPPRALLRLWGVYAHRPPSALGGHAARGLVLCSGGAFSCARALLRFEG